MPLFKRENHDEWRRKRSQERLALGGLPLNAEYRLRRLADNPRLFTTLMSVNEFALTRAAGLMPCGQVTGTSVYNIGWQPIPVFSSMELFPLSQAETQGRRLALVRMLRQAEQLGAHGVIGVRLTENGHGWSEKVREYTAVGTAIRLPQSRPAGFPFASTLSGQEVLALQQSGYAPTGIVMGICVYYQVASPATTRVMQGGPLNSAARCNQEMTEYTWGLNSARHQALTCVEEDAASHHASGVVGLQIDKRLEGHEVEIELYERKVTRHDLIVTFSALGSSIRWFRDSEPPIHAALPLG